MQKIIFIANNNIGFGGLSGGDRIFIEFIKNWYDKQDITLLGSEEAITISKERDVSNIGFIETDKASPFSHTSLLGLAAHYLRRITKGIIAVRKINCSEISHVYSISDFLPDLLPAFYLKKIRNKNIIWIAGYYLFAPSPFASDSPYKGLARLRGFIYWFLQRISYPIVNHYADYVLVTSEPDVDKFITKSRPRNKIIVVQGGVDISEAKQYLPFKEDIANKKYDACFVGRLHCQKGVRELIDIWREVVAKKSNAKLAIIGNGGLEHELKEKIAEFNLGKNIDMLGFKDGKEKYAIFKGSKMILHPAIYDSGGMAAAEGMAWGLPGISFDLEALKTYYPQGMIKTKCFDKQEFADNILKLLSNASFYEHVSEEARELIFEVWDWNKRADGIYDRIFLTSRV